MDLVGQPGEADRALAARFAPLLAEALSGAFAIPLTVERVQTPPFSPFHPYDSVAPILA
jgi:hypothetical protein